MFKLSKGVEMILELKNETALVRFVDNYDIAGMDKRYPDLVLPTISTDIEGSASNVKGEEVVLPLMLGELVRLGTGRELEDGRVVLPEGLSVGQTVLFKVNDQIAYEDRQDHETYYLIGIGNILAVIK
jgi:co-chaperonin GroES (HSP10)